MTSLCNSNIAGTVGLEKLKCTQQSDGEERRGLFVAWACFVR